MSPPELVIEVLSPDDRWSDVMEKVADYLAAGVLRVWILDQRLTRAFAYRSLSEVRVFEQDGVLTTMKSCPDSPCRSPRAPPRLADSV